MGAGPGPWAGPPSQGSCSASRGSSRCSCCCRSRSPSSGTSRSSAGGIAIVRCGPWAPCSRPGSSPRRWWGRGSPTSQARSRVTAACRSSRRRRCCRPASGSGTTRSSSASSCRSRSSAPASRCCSCVDRTDRGRAVPRLARGPPTRPEGATLLLPWWIVPWILAILYQPTWPLEDALRPQRMWLVASQPGLILAAIGLVAGAEELVATTAVRPADPGSRGRRGHPRRVPPHDDRHGAPALDVVDRSPLCPPPPHPRSRPRHGRPAARGRAAADGPHLRGLVVARLVRHRSGRGRRRATRLREARVRPGRLHGRRPAPAPSGPRDGAPGRPTRRSWPLPTPTTPIASCSHGGTTGSG